MKRFSLILAFFTLGSGFLLAGPQAETQEKPLFPADPKTYPVETRSQTQLDKYFDSLVSTKTLGYSFDGKKSTFRVFVPRGKTVELVIFNKFDGPEAQVIPMTADPQMVFEAEVEGPLWGKFYAYRITDRLAKPKDFSPKVPANTLFADPYSFATAQSNTYPQISRSLIFDLNAYDWAGDKPTGLDISNATIYEAHIRDLSADKTAGVPDSIKNPGSFKGFLEAKRGGLTYVKNLGVNAIQFLPLHEFANIENPFKQKTPYDATNTWNAYAQNYWGYMTSNFFALESYYGSDGTLDPQAWNGTDGRVVTEFRDLVRALHKEGISVILDVVYNHASKCVNSLKLIDFDYYFKEKDYIGLGGEINTKRPMVRKLIVESLKHFLVNYHVDGFRFDLAASFDPEAAKIFAEEIRKVNPKAFVIAEPWGGEGLTNSKTFADIGWSMWDPEIRSVVKTETRPTSKGENLVLGTNPDAAAQLETPWVGGSRGKPWQSVSYFECHDDTTFGDALRILSGEYQFTVNGKTNRIPDVAAYQKLSPNLMKASKLAAVSLFLSNTPIMIHAGQEWSRGKVTPDLKGKIPELSKGALGSSSDSLAYLTPAPNSYSADNETNWLNFDYADSNKELFDYYKGLIALRQSSPILGKTDPKKLEVLYGDQGSCLGLNMDGKIFGFVNTHLTDSGTFTLPNGNYSLVVDENVAGTKEIKTVKGGTLTIPPRAAWILIKK